jgi:hypothetical protein
LLYAAKGLLWTGGTMYVDGGVDTVAGEKRDRVPLDKAIKAMTVKEAPVMTARIATM